MSPWKEPGAQGPSLPRQALPEHTFLAGKHRREQRGLGSETLQKEAAISLPANVPLSLNWPLICFLCFQRAQVSPETVWDAGVWLLR